MIEADSVIDAILKKARESPRKRAVHCFHKPGDRLQRMINAGLSDTYIQPHKHENPDKLEIFCILKGKAAIIFFNDEGEIKDFSILSEDGNKTAEIPPRTWHNLIILSEEAALFEIIDAKYDEKTHKKLAPWAPEEGTEESISYLKQLKKKIKEL